jgi:large subunit ribosomal protein L9
MKIFMRKDLEKVGLTGEMISVDDGYGRNFLIPRGYGVEVTAENEGSFSKRSRQVEKRQEVIATKTSILGDKIKSTKLTIRRKMHDDGKLYGAINHHEIIELLSEKGIILSKNQLRLDKMIKEKGT